MRYHWLANHLVQKRFPLLDQETRNQIVSEAVCRAWCSFAELDYRLMQACVDAAAQRKGLMPLQHLSARPAGAVEPPGRRVIRLSDYR
jgi:hypothetical protein